MDDAEYDAVILYLKQGVAPSQWSQEQKKFYTQSCSLIKGTLHKTQNNLPIPRREILKSIILSLHVDEAGEHLDEENTMVRLRHQFHVANPEAEVRKYIEDCKICLRRQLQQVRHLLAERDAALVAKAREAESLLACQQKFFDAQATIEALKSELGNSTAKLFACDAANRRLLAHNSMTSDSLSKKCCEFSKLQAKLQSVRSLYHPERDHGNGTAGFSNLLKQNKMFRNMWRTEVEVSKTLKTQLDEKTKELLDFQNLIQKKVTEFNNLRRSVNILRSTCKAQAEQIKQLKDHVRKREPDRINDCKDIVAVSAAS